jgi:hypothetical protein
MANEMKVSDVKTAAILEYFNNGGTSTDFATPTMYSRWINQATTEIWSKLIGLDVNWYNFRKKTLTVVSGTDAYALDITCARVTGMAIRTGTSPNYNYQIITPLNESRDNFYISGNGLWNATQNLAPSGFQWYEGESALSTGQFIRKIILTPVPQSNFTAVYDGQRYTVPVDVPPASESTAYIDLPFDFFEPLVLRVVRSALRRDQVNTDEIQKDIDRLDSYIFPTHSSSIQRQSAQRVSKRRI